MNKLEFVEDARGLLASIKEAADNLDKELKYKHEQVYENVDHDEFLEVLEEAKTTLWEL